MTYEERMYVQSLEERLEVIERLLAITRCATLEDLKAIQTPTIDAQPQIPSTEGFDKSPYVPKSYSKK